MRPVILTTETLHHAYFVRELARLYPNLVVFEETTLSVASFPTAHPFEQKRDDHERQHWFEGEHRKCSDFAEVRTFETVNSPRAIEDLSRLRPDVVLVVGTGRLSREFIAAAPVGALVNLHGGDPEEYRGLDSHLWATYHGDFGALTTVLHTVAPELDSGDIVAALAVPLQRGMLISQLRQANTAAALQLALWGLEYFRAHRRFASRPQRRAGRYYSFMPAVLKGICEKKFQRHCETLS